MERTLGLLVASLLAVGLCAPTAVALDPIGPPTACLEQGQFSAGLEYFYEDTDIQMTNNTVFGGLVPDFEMDVDEHMVTANVAYGLLDTWDVFVRLGAEVDGDADGTAPFSGSVSFDGDASGVIGLGTRITVYEKDKLKVGGLFQVAWSDSEGDVTWAGPKSDVDVEMTEFTFAVGPTYALTDQVSIYGGPFAYILDGEVSGNLAGAPLRQDIEQSSPIGGYVGALVDIDENLTCRIEYLHTDSADAVGVAVVWTFK